MTPTSTAVTLASALESLESLAIPEIPACWYHACPVSTLASGPRTFQIGATPITLFKTRSGKVSALAAHCCHMGADLGTGEVVGEHIQCPLHGWQYDAQGCCVDIPCGETIPAQACQRAYPVKVLAGHVFVFNKTVAQFHAPFFPECDPESLISAPPFEVICEAPWHVVSSNGFDLQHFGFTHDRKLEGPICVDDPHPFCRRLTARFSIVGSSWRDRLTRAIRGKTVTFRVSSWGGGTILVEAAFRRTTTYGYVSIHPLTAGSCRIRVIIFTKRPGFPSALLAPIDVKIRSAFVKAFMAPDVAALKGVEIDPWRLIQADRTLYEYLTWLAKASSTPATSQGDMQ